LKANPPKGGIFGGASRCPSYVQADDIEDQGERFSVDSIQIAFTIRWYMKGPKVE
jgi:hypothetical protein